MSQEFDLRSEGSGKADGGPAGRVGALREVCGNGDCFDLQSVAVDGNREQRFGGAPDQPVPLGECCVAF